ncbi:hypothetical protein [Flavobacterium sp. W21_SRS_FM6]|uniref:hypothetical protein n=1 Tax=Flavobacterium sp. W21_SRS_FM6 TaxID=3240268 RepID=UPI003F8DB586
MNIKLSSTFLVMVFTSACTNHLYQGTTTYQENNKQCEAMVYWYDMSTLFSEGEKPSTIVIRNASNPRSFQISQDNKQTNDDKIHLVESKSDYSRVIGESKSDFTDVDCGYFAGKQAHQQGLSAVTEFYLYCQKKVHPVRGGDTSGLQARANPYVFKMAEPISAFSWWGKLPNVDAVKLNCQ